MITIIFISHKRQANTVRKREIVMTMKSFRDSKKITRMDKIINQLKSSHREVELVASSVPYN